MTLTYIENEPLTSIKLNNPISLCSHSFVRRIGFIKNRNSSSKHGLYYYTFQFSVAVLKPIFIPKITNKIDEILIYFLHLQEAVINELKTKSQAVGEKKLLHQDEVYNGALEDILHGLRSEPYRRADAVRRSHRRRINSHRLSKGLEELDV